MIAKACIGCPNSDWVRRECCQLDHFTNAKNPYKSLYSKHLQNLYRTLRIRKISKFSTRFEHIFGKLFNFLIVIPKNGAFCTRTPSTAYRFHKCWPSEAKPKKKFFSNSQRYLSHNLREKNENLIKIFQNFRKILTNY